MDAAGFDKAQQLQDECQRLEYSIRELQKADMIEHSSGDQKGGTAYVLYSFETEPEKLFR